MIHLRTLVILIFLCLIFFCALPVGAQVPGFKSLVEANLTRRNMRLSDVCPVDTNRTARRIFAEYGAVFIAENTVALPFKCIFSGEEQVQLFQGNISTKTVVLDGVSITLQAPAMEALLKAREKAAQMRLRISPRGGSLAARRSYEDTRALWNTRFLPGLQFWVRKRKLSKNEAEAAKRLPVEAQIGQVLDWEVNRKLFFSKDLSKSILYSVAAPGASQHNFLLAIDVQQFADKRVRAILAEFGWFQTVKSDLPHFTYLGRKESELPALGLKPVLINGQNFWIPDFE